MKESHTDKIDWSAWLAEYGSRLLLYARQLCRSEASAADITQSALIQLTHAVESGAITGSSSQWIAYAHTVIRHKAIDEGRRIQVRDVYAAKQQETLKEGKEETPWLSCSADLEYLRKRLEGLLKELSPEYAEVVVLHIWNEFTFQQIADMTETKLATITSRYRYALKAMRNLLEDNPIDYK